LIQQNTSVHRDLHQISCRGSSTNRRKWFIIICFCLLRHSLFSLHKKQKPSQTKLGAFTVEIQHVACFSYDLFCYLSRRQYWPVSFLHVFFCVCVCGKLEYMGWSRLNHSLSDNSKAVEYETREGVRAGLQLRMLISMSTQGDG
jgi:hypothetical protein